MQTMTKAALESACEKTVDEWDMQTLVQFAIDSMLEVALSVSPVYVVISDNGAFHASTDTEADAVEIAARVSDEYNTYSVFMIAT